MVCLIQGRRDFPCGHGNDATACVIKTAAQSDYSWWSPPTADPAQDSLSQTDVTSWDKKTNLPVSFLGGFSSRRYQMIRETVEVRRLVFVRVTLCFWVLLPKSQAIVSSTPLDSFWPESDLHRRVSALRWRTEAAEEHSWDHYSLGLRCLVCRLACFSPVHAVSYLCCVTAT